MSTPVIRLSGLHKGFRGVVALSDVSIELRAGEVHCLAGENGAGKSTLIRILTGALRRDAGLYEVDGRAMTTTFTPAAARQAGIGAVYQELSLLPDLSVAENLMMGRLPTRGGILNKRSLREQARRKLDRVGLDVDPAARVDELPAATRQLVEIAKVLGDDPRVIVFDEPTTALSGAEAESLLRRVSGLRDEGVAVLYVSHRLEEMFEIGDRVTVLRDGTVTRSGPMPEFTEDSLISAMVGRDVHDLYPAHERGAEQATPLLRVRGLRPAGSPHTVDLDVRAGEIVGVAGLLGAGRSELLRAIFGADPPESGTVEVDGGRVPPGRPREAVRAGIGLLSEDRKELGLLPQLTVRENVSVASLTSIGTRGLLSRKKEAARVDEVLDSLRLRAGSYDQPVSTLSGGNQQKVLIARWLVTDVRVLLFDEPTKGVDIGAKAELYTLIGDLAARGFAIVVVSSYLPELLGLADRIVVLRRGALVGDVTASEATEEGLLTLASTGRLNGAA